MESKRKICSEEYSELAIYYCTVLIFLRRYSCCETSLEIAFKIVKKSKDKKGEANLRRIKGCLHIMLK